MQQLPQTISNYFKATNAQDLAKIMDCFDQDAIIQDVGESLEIKGSSAIQKWVEKLISEYKLQINPQEAFVNSETIEVIAEVAGSFAGSPLRFHYNFKMKKNLIIFLKITIR